MKKRGVSKKAIKELEKYRKIEEDLDLEKLPTIRRQLAFEFLEGVPEDGRPYLLRHGHEHVLVKINPFSRRKDVWYMDGTAQEWKREEEVVMTGRRRVFTGMIYDIEDHDDEVREQSAKERTARFIIENKEERADTAFRAFADEWLENMGIK